LKTLSSFYILLNSIRVYEISFIKTKIYIVFYSDVFDFLIKTINDDTYDPELDGEALEPGQENKHVAKQQFVFRFLLALFIQHRTVVFSSAELLETANVLSSRFTRIKELFLTKIKPIINDKDEISIYSLVIEIYDLITSYAAQFQKRPSESTHKENAAYEKKLTQRLTQLGKAVEKEKNVFFEWILNMLMEFFFAIISQVYLNKSNLHATFMTESLIECMRFFSFVCAHNLKSLNASSTKMNSQTESSSSNSKSAGCDLQLAKNALFKPLMYFTTIGKQAELLLKTSNHNLFILKAETYCKYS
jgi:hypothetical protein